MRKILLFLILLGVLLVLPLASSILSDNVVLYYNFNTTADLTGQGHTLIASGSPTLAATIPKLIGFNGNISATNYFDTTNTATVMNFGGGTFTIVGWVNLRNTGAMNILDYHTQGNPSDGWFVDQTAANKLEFTKDSGNEKVTSIVSLIQNNWTMFSVTQNASHRCLWINATLDSCIATSTITSSADNLEIGRATLEAQFDELGIWNVSLNGDDMLLIYNQGNGATYPFTGLTGSLISPADGDGFLNNNITFNASFNALDNTAKNLTLYLYNDDVLINSSITNNVEGDPINSSSFNLILDEGSYSWNAFFCTDDGSADCNFVSSNNSFTVGIVFDTTNFSSPVIETVGQTITLNFTIPNGKSVQTAVLIYNGSIISGASSSNTAGNSWLVSKSFTTPAVNIGSNNETRSFFWNVTLSNITSGETISFSSPLNSQVAVELVFGMCGQFGNLADVPVLNFTMRDEITQSLINGVTNATTFQATFNIGATSGLLIKNYSINNLSVADNSFAFCTNEPTNTLFANMVADYGAVDYADSHHILNNASLNNNPNNVTLFLLPNSEAVQFFITVKQNLFGLEGATVTISKFFVGEGVYKTVEIANTDSAGKITANLQLNKDYRFSIVKNSVLLGVFDRESSCEAAPCKITLNLDGNTVDPYGSFYDFYASNVVYNLSYDALAKVVTFDFLDITGLATAFRMVVYETSYADGDIVISDQTVFTSSGSMTYNASALDNGDYRVEVFVSRSPFQIIDFLNFVISDLATQLGGLGLLVSLILVLIIIFGMALSPAMLIFAVPFSLLIVKLAGLALINNGVIITLLLLSGVLVYLLKK